MPKRPKSDSGLQASLVQAARLHFVYAFLLVIQIILYHAWALITPQAALRRWLATGAFVIGITAVWYIAKNSNASTHLKSGLYGLIMLDIGIASFGVYTQRGMAARAVALYAIPIITAAILRSRSALLATATLSTIAYTSTAMAYFVVNFNEGLKIELYGEVGFYSVMFFVLARLLWINTSASRR